MLMKQATSGKRSQIELQSRTIVITFKCGIFCEDRTQTQMVSMLYCQDLQQYYIQNGSRNQQAFSLEGKGALSCVQI